MSLSGALNVGRSALAVQQSALQVTGNNIANAGNADYTRQTASIKPNRDQQIRPGVFLGQGVNLDNVGRDSGAVLDQLFEEQDLVVVLFLLGVSHRVHLRSSMPRRAQISPR